MSSAFTPVNRPGLPKKPYTPEKPKGAKAMTIVVGFLYQDGAILCADSQITGPNSLKYPDHKIFSFDVDGCRCVFAFADAVGLATELRTKIFRKLGEYLRDADVEVSSEEFYKAIETVVDEQGRLYVDLPVQFVLAAYPTNEHPVLFHFDGKSLNKTTGLTVLGCGNEPLVKFLSDHLYKQNLTKEEAFAVAGYLVRKAARHVDLCAEPIEAVILEKGKVQEVNEMVRVGAMAVEMQERSLFDFLITKIFEDF